MGMVVRSNIMALNAQRQLGMNNSQVGKSLEKLSSGFKINRAGDDASGLAISEKMKAQIKALDTASSNCQDGVSLVQTAEGALTEVHDMLNRIVELSEKAANGTMEMAKDENGNSISGEYGNGGTDRDAIQVEVDQLATEIDRIAKSANFNGIKLLDGSLSSEAIKGAVSGASKLPQAVNFQGSTNITGKIVGPSKSIGKFEISAQGVANETVTFRYLDTKGVSQEVEIGLSGAATGSKEAWAKDLVTQTKDLGNKDNADSEDEVIEFMKLFDIKYDDGYIVVESKNTGAEAPRILEMMTGTTDNVITNKAGDKVAADEYAEASDVYGGRDKSFEITFGKTAPKAGETIKIGDMTFEFIAKATDSAKSGNIGVVLGVGGSAAATTAANLVQALKDNGISNVSNADADGEATTTVYITDIDKISGQQGGAFGIQSTSDGVAVENVLEKGATYETAAGKTFLSQGAKGLLEISFMTEDGEFKTLNLDYTEGNKKAEAATTGANIAALLKNNEEFKKYFDISADETTGNLTASVKDLEGSSKVKLVGISLKDAAGNDLLGATSEKASAIEPGKTLAVSAKDIKSGDTVTIDGKTYEFVDKATTDLTDPNNIKVLIAEDDNAGTGKNLKAAMEKYGNLSEGDDFSFDAKTGKFTFQDNGLKLSSSSTQNGLTLQIGDTYESFNLLNVSIDHMDMASLFKGTEATMVSLAPDDAGDVVKSLDVSSQEQAGHTLNAVKVAINKVSTQRAKLGAAQNRLEHTINNLDVTAENMNSANSRIRDTDMAKQMMDYTKMNVLTQAAQAMLAQANQQPQSVLQLLQ